MEREVLQSLSPEQLDVLSERARRLRRGAGDIDPGNDKPLDTVLRVTGPEPEALRAVAESVLAGEVKAWKFGGIVAGDNGVPAIEYRLRLRRKVPASLLVARLRDRLGSAAQSVELS
jgi:hypothetical protein